MTSEMITKQGYLVDVTYQNLAGQSVPVMWFSDSKGAHFSVMDWDFWPYFIVRKSTGSNYDSLEKRVQLAATVKGVQVRKFGRGSLKYHGAHYAVLAVEFHNVPSLVEVRDAVARLPGVLELHETDIVYSSRYIINKGLVPGKLYNVTYNKNDKYASGSLVGMKLVENAAPFSPLAISVDIETRPREDGQFPTSKEDPIIIISITDDKNDIIFRVDKGSEKEIIQNLVDFIQHTNPDFIVTYNGNKFDIEYLMDRAEANGIEFNVGRDGRPPRVRAARNKWGRTNIIDITGRVHMDLFPIIQRDYDNITVKMGKLEVKAPKDLKTVAEFMGVLKKENREMLSPEDMLEVWRDDPDRFCRYATDDTRATHGLYQKIIEQQLSWSEITRQRLQDTVSSDRGKQAEHYFWISAYSEDEIIPNKKYGGGAGMGKGTGGYVGDPVIGMHEDVHSFDFSSMYPSIVIKNNIGPDTYIDPSNPDWSREDNIVVPELGHKFYNPKVRRSFVARMVEDLLVRRGKLKKLRDQAKARGDDTMEKIYEEQQYVVKVLANTGCFGYLGWPASRWFHKPTSESITAFGRHYIGEVNTIGNKYGLMYLYNDTDSYKCKEKGVRVDTDAFLKEVNTTLPIKIAFEQTSPLAFFVVPKRYFYTKEDGSIVVKGLEVRRTDWCRHAQRAQAAVIECIVETRDVRKVMELAKEYVRQVRQGKVPLEDLVIHKGLSKDAADYENVMVHTAAVAREVEEFGESQYEAGDKVPIIVADLGEKGVTKNTVTLSMFRRKNLKLDTKYYCEKQVLAAVSRITDVLGIDHDVILGRPAQKKLEV